MTTLSRLLVALFLFASVAVSAQDDVHLMANISPPYADEQLPERGLALEIVSHVFGATDYQTKITIENWSRAVEGATLGVYDGLAAAWFSEARNETLLFSEPYLSSELMILKHRTNPRNYRSLQDLSGGRIGVRVDYAYGVDLGAIPGLVQVPENQLVQQLVNLDKGAVDFVIGDKRTIIAQLNTYMKDKLVNFIPLNIQLPKVQRHVAVSRDLAGHEKIVQQFNDALKKAGEDGSLNEIVVAWDERLGSIQ